VITCEISVFVDVGRPPEILCDHGDVTANPTCIPMTNECDNTSTIKTHFIHLTIPTLSKYDQTLFKTITCIIFKCLPQCRKKAPSPQIRSSPRAPKPTTKLVCCSSDLSLYTTADTERDSRQRQTLPPRADNLRRLPQPTTHQERGKEGPDS
jgi:hypothetical protein